MWQTTLGIDGMACGMCETHVNDAIRRRFTVKSVKSSRKKRQCIVVSAELLDEGLLQQVIAETGYELLSIDVAPYQKKSFFGF